MFKINNYVIYSLDREGDTLISRLYFIYNDNKYILCNVYIKDNTGYVNYIDKNIYGLSLIKINIDEFNEGITQYSKEIITRIYNFIGYRPLNKDYFEYEVNSIYGTIIDTIKDEKSIYDLNEYWNSLTEEEQSAVIEKLRELTLNGIFDVKTGILYQSKTLIRTYFKENYLNLNTYLNKALGLKVPIDYRINKNKIQLQKIAELL